MLIGLIQKEMTETVLDLRFAMTTLLFMVFIPLGMYVNCKDFTRRLEGYQRQYQAYRDEYAREVDRSTDPQGFRPPSALSILANGLDPFMSDRVITSSSGRFTLQGSALASHPLSLLLGKADFLFNMTFVVSLAALVFSFSAVSGERETGTLRLLIASSVPRGQILVAKVLGRIITLVIPWLLSILLALLLLAASPVVSLSSSEVWPALLAVLGVSLLFMLGMVCLGVCISALARHNMVSMVLVFFVWMLFAVVIPRVSPLVAGILYPVETRAVVDLTLRIAEDDIEQERHSERYKMSDRYNAEFGLPADPGPDPNIQEYNRIVKRVNAKLAQEFPLIDEKYRLQKAETIHRIEENYRNRQNAQFFMATTLSRISPVSCYTYVISSIAGTGLTEPDNLLRHAQRYQDQMNEAVHNSAVLPNMVYHYPTLAEALHMVWPDILLLGLFSVLFFVLAFAGFNRYDVR